MTPEKKALYEMLVLLKTHVATGRPQHKCGYVFAIKNKLTIDLKRQKLENEMSGGPETSADDILLTLDELYAEAARTTEAVSAEEELGVAVNDEDGEDDNRAPSPDVNASVNSKQTVFEKMGDGITLMGREKLLEKYYVSIRAEKARITKEKCLLRECIVNSLSGVNKDVSVSFKTTSRRMGSWQAHVRSVPNNLKLKH